MLKLNGSFGMNAALIYLFMLAELSESVLDRVGDYWLGVWTEAILHIFFVISSSLGGD